MQAAAVLAHPLLETGGLPVPPLVLATVGVLAVLAAALLRRSTPAEPPMVAEPRMGPAAAAGRALGLAALVVAITAGRMGRNQVTANLAPALVVGVGWPLLVIGSAVLGRVWDRLDPWDTLAHLAAAVTGDRDPQTQASHVWWALPGAAALVWYLAAYREALLPHSLATALVLYTILAVAGSLAWGRGWLRRAEVIGILLRWIGLLRHRRLVAWAAPAGAAVVLGVVAGGLLFGLLRFSRLLNPLVFGLPDLPAETVGVAVLAALGAGAVWAAERACRRVGAPGTAVAAVVPVVAGLAVAEAMVGGQLVLALQVLPAVASDPLGRGWDLFGTAHMRFGPNPFSAALHSGVQAAVIVAGGVAAGRIARHRAVAATATGESRRAVSPAAGVAGLLVAAGVLATTAI